jgi:hypothetical protein
MNELGKILICGGSDIALVGFFLWSGFAPRWLGRLPGDIRIERGQTVFYFPIVTCVVLNLILSISQR